ncbi:MAG: hypothetical protein JNL83_13210, partial [Myxococcales bacterium]|nr:hypothetical protein [Myxococcales bacterium]
MAGTKPPGNKGTGKPFLGDDDLASELDAWDATFDALHVDDTSAAPAPEPVMAWPAPAATIASPPPPSAADFGAEPSSTLDQPVFEDQSLDDQMTLDRAQDDNDALIDVEVEVPLAGPRTPAHVDTYDSDPAETDFSDVGAQGQPAALGEMLGRHGTVPPIDDLDEPPTRIDLKSGPVRRPTVSDEDDSDDGVFTSASRPVPAAPDDGRAVDPIAPPPAPEPARRGPAIVRRTPIQVQPVTPSSPPPREERKTPAHGVDTTAFNESTRIQSLGEIEAQAAATRQRHQNKTAPPPIADDDDEYEVEIDAQGGGDAAAPEPMPDSALSRRTAHVVRRADTPTRPPPLGPGGIPIIPAGLGADDGGGEVAMEMDVDEPTDTAEPAGEDDFSDVAAAVGGAEDPLADLPAAPQPLTPRRASTPDLERQLGNRTIRPGLSGAINQPPPTPRAPLEDALAALDEEPPALESPVPQFDDDTTGFGAVPSNKFADAPPTVIDERPPALASAGDYQPRVKTPTSVPPLGQPAHGTAIEALTGETLSGTRAPAPAAVPRAPSQIPLEIEEPAPDPVLDVEAAVRAWPAQIEPLGPTALDEDAAQALLVYERELATLDEAAASAALRIEAGRLSERLHDPDRARAHYDAALLADPRATAALRGLRRIARAAGDLVEAVQHLDAEIAVAGALERRPLGHYRIDLLMASNEQDLARVAVGEILDSAPSDVRALLAQLELAFLDGRADEFGSALEQLGNAVTDHELRAAVQSARGALAAHHNDVAGAASWFSAAAESDPTSLAARIGAVRQAAGQVDGPGAARALIDLAAQVASTDPLTASAAAVRAQQWQGGELGAAAAAIAIAGAPQDPLVARLAAETAAGGDPGVAAGAYTHWSSIGASPVERAYAAARAAELDAGRAAALWGAALELDPGDDYGAAQLRTAHVAAESTQASIDVDLAVANSDPDRERARLRAAYGLIAQGGLEDAITVLQDGCKARPGSLALAEALAEALAAAGRWSDRAKLYAELAAEPGEQLDKDVAQLRSALA